MASIAVGMCPSAAASPRSSPTVAGAVPARRGAVEPVATVRGLASKAGQRPEMTDGFVLTDVVAVRQAQPRHFRATSSSFVLSAVTSELNGQRQPSAVRARHPLHTPACRCCTRPSPPL